MHGTEVVMRSHPVHNEFEDKLPRMSKIIFSYLLTLISNIKVLKKSFFCFVLILKSVLQSVLTILV